MIVVDPSALLAILFEEPEREQYRKVLDDAATLLVSSTSIVEARMVAFGRQGHAQVAVLDELIEGYDFEIVPPSVDEIQIAHSAFVTYGKGSGHPAQLNFGDLFSYALAKSRNLPLLFKGNDFSQTDLHPAI